MTENNEAIFQILGRLKVAVDGNSRAQELIAILDKKLKDLPLDGDYERILLFKNKKQSSDQDMTAQELREEHVYGEVLEQQIMEAQDEKDFI